MGGLDMDKILIQQNPHWNDHIYDNLISRKILADLKKQLELSEILILQGIRRSGKSTLFQLLINELVKRVHAKSILYVNLDDPFFSDIRTDPKSFYTVVETAEKIVGCKVQYLFLDEVQNVEGWEQFVKSTYDSNIFKKIFITGSNSSLLSSQYATLLTGRYIKQHIYPLSFHEILINLGITDKVKLLDQKSQVLRVVDSIMQYGSFPKVYLTNDVDLKRSQLISYYETIIYKDCIDNNGIRDTKTFKDLCHYMISHAGSAYSYKSLSKFLGCSDVTIKEFINIIQGCYILQELTEYSLSLQKQIKGKKKSYIIDNGFIHAIAFKFFDAKGQLFENLVYSELNKVFGQEVYFYNVNNECDFIINDNNELTAIQVCYTITAENRTRELNGLKSVMNEFNCNKAYIITYDQEETISDKIEFVPFWKFFFK